MAVHDLFWSATESHILTDVLELLETPPPPRTTGAAEGHVAVIIVWSWDQLLPPTVDTMTYPAGLSPHTTYTVNEVEAAEALFMSTHQPVSKGCVRVDIDGHPPGVGQCPAAADEAIRRTGRTP